MRSGRLAARDRPSRPPWNAASNLAGSRPMIPIRWTHFGIIALAACAPVPAETRDDPDGICVASAAAPVTASLSPPSGGLAEAPNLGPPPLYGFWGLNGYVSATGFTDVIQRFGISVFQVASSEPTYAVGTLLPTARSVGLKVTLRMTTDHPGYTTDGDFDLGLWKAQLAPWIGSGVQPFIDDGTLVGHMLLDDITNFEGRDPDAADLDEMARCSKQLFPGLMTYVRQRASRMPSPAPGRYEYVDAAVNQYDFLDGEVNRYAKHEQLFAARRGLGVINGLNIADGGDGSSGQPGWRAGHWAMSAEEITRYGAVLAAVPTCGMFLNWEYDGQEAWSDGTIGDDYFDQPELRAALTDLGVLVGQHRHVTLLKPD